MVKAVWNGAVLAESDRTVLVEGNHYFDPQDVRMDLLEPSTHHTTCPWKGHASYHHVRVGDRLNPDAAWVYHDPKPAAKALGIQDRIAFWKGVQVET